MDGKAPTHILMEQWEVKVTAVPTVPQARDISPEEWAVRVDLAAAYRLVALNNWDDLVFTHLSASVPGPDAHFLINPFNQLFDEITASSLVKIDLEGNKVLDDAAPINRAGFVIHSAIHAARKDAVAVFHLHTPYGQAASAMRDGLLPQTQTAMVAQHELAYHEYEGIATDEGEKARIVADLGDRHSMILRNHGTLAVGSSVAAAFLRIYNLERACEAQVHMLAAGTEGLHLPSPDAVTKVAKQTDAARMNHYADELIWPALLRKLDRLCPGFRD